MKHLTPMSYEEWLEFGNATLRGVPPWRTLRRIFLTVGKLFSDVEELKAEKQALQDALDEERRLK